MLLAAAHFTKRDTMKRFLASITLAFVFALSLPACSKLPPVKWPELVNCGTDAGRDLVDDATQILYTDGGIDKHTIGDKAKDLLTDLARDHGADVVACVVQRLIDTWTEPGATAEPRRTAATDRARDFLAKVGTDTSGS